MTRIIDISVPVYSGMVYFPGDAGVEVEPYHEITKGDHANLSVLKLGSHSGTHVDAPRHFVDGMAGVDELPLEALVGPARVLDLTGAAGSVSAAGLESAGLGDAVRVLLKTSNSGLWDSDEFSTQYVSLDDDAASLLVDRGVRLVGIDYLSIEKFRSRTTHVHQTLLRASVIILEGVDLRNVDAGDYQLACLPLKIRGGDGAPARAVLIEG